MNRYRSIRILSLLSLALWVVGCKSMTPGSLSWIQTDSDRPYAGNVYLLRGFIGIWSYGVDHIGEKINAAGIRASVFQEDQWSQVCDTIIEKYQNEPTHEPLILIGHSYGADDVIRIARRLQEDHINVDLVITLDPVTPPHVPSNIRLCYNIYQSNLLDALPFFRGVPLVPDDQSQKNLQNINIRTDRTDLLEPGTDHFNIEKNEKIHAEILRKVKEFCPVRSAWVAQMRARQAGGISTGADASGRIDTPAAPDADDRGGTTGDAARPVRTSQAGL